MVWQDIVIAVCSWAATLALLPSIWGSDKPALSSSLFTAAIVITFGICYFTLGLLSAAASAWVLAAAWLILAYQKWRQRPKESVRL
jgi:predicted benzoate:H+ symporter BenE